MNERMHVGQLYPGNVPPVAPTQKKPVSPAAAGGIGQKSFRELFASELVRLSQHAESRLIQRGIRFTPEQMTKIEAAIDKAAAKGAKDSLIVMQDLALIVSVKNRTIVTAVDSASVKDNVFTNIDSAVIVS
ncbi:MAG TPA: TIGR02530 family flagellar biosynthesis protein [Bacilli bacterium]